LAVRSLHGFYRLPHRTATGSWNMDADRSLLAWVSQAPARLVFRTYGWERPTLSLGRSELFPHGWDRDSVERAGVEVVRRPTGGSAVLHVEEVTFALAASIPGPWRLTPRGFAAAAAEALSGALQGCGIDDSRVQDAGKPRGEAPGAGLCFARSAPGEVLAGAYKVAGIASRFGRGGALCHASIPLTARSRSVARFRSEPDLEAETLEQNARSLGELLGLEGADVRVQALGERITERLAVEVEARFDVRWIEAPFETVGIEECEPASSR